MYMPIPFSGVISVFSFFFYCTFVCACRYFDFLILYSTLLYSTLLYSTLTLLVKNKFQLGTP